MSAKARLAKLEKHAPKASDNPYMTCPPSELLALAKEISQRPNEYPSELFSLCARIANEHAT